jgi:hypothetical protein
MFVYYAFYMVAAFYSIYRIFWTKNKNEAHMGRLIWGACLFVIASGTLLSVWAIHTMPDFPGTTSAAMLIVFVGVVWGCIGALLHLVMWIYSRVSKYYKNDRKYRQM